MTSVRQILECRRTARNLQQFLDRDPAAPLSEDDMRRVQIHLGECEKCTELSKEYEALHRSLRRLGSSLAPEPATVDRVREAVERALAAEGH